MAEKPATYLAHWGRTYLYSPGQIRHFFPYLFLSCLSALLLLLPFAFHLLPGCRKKLGVNYGQEKMSAKPVNGTFINNRYNGPLYPHFCTETDNVVRVNLILHQNAVDNQN